MRKTAAGLAALAAVGVLAACTPAGVTNAAASPEDAVKALKGQTITLVVPFDPGGGYDAYARMLAPELGEELGATVIVENKPGAGGILATNEVIHARPDGKTLVLLNGPGHLGAALAGAEGALYDAEAMSYIGQISSEPDVVATSNSSGIGSADDLAGKRFAATGPGSNEYIDAVVLNALLGLDNEIVTGFASSNEASLNVVQGNIELHSRSFGSQLPGIDAGDLVPVLVIGTNTGEEQIADVDVLADVVPSSKAKLAELHSALVSSGRIIAAPPAMGEATLQVIRDAFERVVSDPGFQKTAAEAGRPVVFASGEDVQSLVIDVMNSSAEYVALIKKAYGN
ncbi:tripartite tricarboxylate transporter substrate-binding protein [Microbacterium sp. BWT-B31]|uniref:tripartite tricarboxylate transporter substrate-binding protein n=1 Tax=Microbacterium sp. BWT-B31 TaxID=3232072 RepID=UPI003528AF6B